MSGCFAETVHLNLRLKTCSTKLNKLFNPPTTVAKGKSTDMAPDDLESKRAQLVDALNAVAKAMRDCASIADHFVETLELAPAASGASSKRKANEIEENGEGKAKRKRQPRKPKDPNEPKRPASAYILFQNEVRKELKSQHPEFSQHELLGMISKLWTEMTEDQKSIYTIANKNAKEKYSVQKAAYDATKSDSVGVPVPAEAAVKAAAKPEPKPDPVAQSPISSSPYESSEEEVAADDDDDEAEDTDEVVQQPVIKKGKHIGGPISRRRISRIS